MKNLKFKISAMTCVSCAGGVEATLKSTNGIEKAGVVFATETAIVDYDENIISKDEILKIVKNMGYVPIDSSLKNSENLEEEQKKKS